MKFNSGHALTLMHHCTKFDDNQMFDDEQMLRYKHDPAYKVFMYDHVTTVVPH